jgi:putative ABC transport system permease protein
MTRKNSSASSHLGPRDLMSEAVAGILQRPGRSGLTMLGTVLGIGAFVAIIGLSQTTAGQIGKQFNVLTATEVIVKDVGGSTSPSYDFPSDADSLIDRLNGVVSAGVWWQVPLSSEVSSFAGYGSSQPLSVYAATPGALTAAGAVIDGSSFTKFDQLHRLHVAILGLAASSELAITDLSNEPAVFIGGEPFAVIGTASGAVRVPQFGLGVIVPASTALATWGVPASSAPAQMIVHTRLGAAQLVASEAPVALSPERASLFLATTPFSPTELRRSVTASVNSLFLVLAGLALVVGALGIANTTLVAILERTSEIGLRRALGARRRHIAIQFLCESTCVGLLGGLVGAALGVLTVLAVALDNNWTAVLQVRLAALAPFAGALIGLLAGLYPALRAALIEPAAALRR